GSDRVSGRRRGAGERRHALFGRDWKPRPRRSKVVAPSVARGSLPTGGIGGREDGGREVGGRHQRELGPNGSRWVLSRGPLYALEPGDGGHAAVPGRSAGGLSASRRVLDDAGRVHWLQP